MLNDIIVGIIAIFCVILIASFFGSFLSKREGLTTNGGSSSSGEAGSAAGYADEIKAKMVELQDTLLIDKYRKSYETTIINLDDYIGMLMVQQCLNLKLDGGKELLTGLNALNTLRNAKDNLNTTLEYLDKQ
jgi:hypothetical protein